jgi:hypothetical protein
MDSIDNFTPKYFTAVVHVSTDGITDAEWNGVYAIPLKVRQHTDLRVTCKGDAVTANAVATVQYRGWLEPSS